MLNTKIVDEREQQGVRRKEANIKGMEIAMESFTTRKK